MLSLALTLSFIFALFTGCSSSDDGRINMPSSSRNYEGAHYQTVIDELKGAGFTNVTTEILEDLITANTGSGHRMKSNWTKNASGAARTICLYRPAAGRCILIASTLGWLSLSKSMTCRICTPTSSATHRLVCWYMTATAWPTWLKDWVTRRSAPQWTCIHMP